jgi:hypothetical protein
MKWREGSTDKNTVVSGISNKAKFSRSAWQATAHF